MENTNNKTPATDSVQYLPLGMCMGVAIGTVTGAAVGNIPLGMSLGLSIGLGLGTCIDAMIKGKKNAVDPEEKQNDN